MKAPLFLALCLLGASCSSVTDGGDQTLGQSSYSLVSVDGQAVPELFSSKPGRIIWEDEDGSMLAVFEGSVECRKDGTAQESYGFRLSQEGSPFWDPILVSLDVVCESGDDGSMRFDYPVTGESLQSTVKDGADACPHLTKALPSEEVLRAGVDPASSRADFPSELAFSTAPVGEFRGSTCISW